MLYIPEYKVNTKKCKHDDAIASNADGIADLVQKEEPLVHQPKRHRNGLII